MNRKENNFDRIAWCYDGLSFLVFGNKIKKSQRVLLKEIKERDRVLILGGGSGWIVQEILAIRAEVEIDYVEYSERMLQKAKSKVALKNGQLVHFIHGDARLLKEENVYDVIIACYFFDVFTEKRLEELILQLIRSMKVCSKLLVADFRLTDYSPFWHKLLIQTMYRFFKMVCFIEASHLGPFRAIILQNGLTRRFSENFYQGFIVSEVYEKK